MYDIVSQVGDERGRPDFVQQFNAVASHHRNFYNNDKYAEDIRRTIDTVTPWRGWLKTWTRFGKRRNCRIRSLRRMLKPAGINLPANAPASGKSRLTGLWWNAFAGGITGTKGERLTFSSVRATRRREPGLPEGARSRGAAAGAGIKGAMGNPGKSTSGSGRPVKAVALSKQPP